MTILSPGETIVTATLNVGGSSKNFVITMGIAASGGPSVTTVLAAWRAALVAAAGPFYVNSMSTGWQLTKVYGLQNSGGIMQSAQDLTPVVGTATGQLTPSPNVSVLVEKITLNAGVRYRGRMSVPPCNIAEVDVNQAGVIASTAMTTQQAMWSYVRNTLTTAGYNLYLFHAASKPGTINPTLTPPRTAITALTVSPLVGTNRRRLR